jgi:hypothetical protein
MACCLIKPNNDLYLFEYVNYSAGQMIEKLEILTDLSCLNGSAAPVLAWT